MLVPSMTIGEIIKELEVDIQGVDRTVFHTLKKLRRQSIKTKKEVYEGYEHTSLKKNNWFINMYVKKNTIAVFPVVYTYNNGFDAYIIDEDNKKITHISSHFLDRYNERFLKGELSIKKDILIDFMRYNPVNLIHVSKTNKNDIFTYTLAGVALGNKMECEFGYTLFQFKTFVTEKMLFENQLELYTSIKETIYNLNKKGSD